jgi:hypothetical protein
LGSISNHAGLIRQQSSLASAGYVAEQFGLANDSARAGSIAKSQQQIGVGATANAGHTMYTILKRFAGF